MNELKLLILLAASTPLGLFAQSADEVAARVRTSVTQEGLERHARVITSYERPSGSAGENAAIDYIVQTLRDAGVPVSVHEFTSYTSNPVSGHISLVGHEFEADAITVAFSGATPGLSARLVDLESGTGENLYLPVGRRVGLPDVTGAIVLIDGQPRNLPLTVIAELGAVGAVFVNPEERLNDLIVTTTWGTPSLRNAHRLPTLPVVQVRRSAGQRIRELMRQGEVTARLTVEVDQGWKTLRLPVARIEPAGDVAPYVLLGGHIDGWYYGGTDEGASNAAMLSMAIAFHEQRSSLRRGLVVAWWPGHSNARYGGSTWFADSFFEELRDRGVAYLNIDGVGQQGARRYSASTTASLQPLALDVIRDRTGERLQRASRPGRNSDQSFNGIALPLLQFNHTRLAEDGGYWWWHTPDDTFDKIDFGILESDTDLYIDAIARIIVAQRVPIDVPAQLTTLVEALEARQQQAGDAFDLSGAVTRARQLVELARVRESDPQAASATELVDVLRSAHRVLYTPLDPYHPDPGRSLGPLPGLAAVTILAEESPSADRYQQALVTLVRERNRVLDAIDQVEKRLRAIRR